MESKELQQNFFDQLKQKLSPHLSLVDEVAELLNISPDSAYRRIRGEKMMAFDEVQKLCVQYNLSIDHLLNLKSDNFIFSGRITNASDFTFEQWQGMVVQHLENIRSHNPRHLYYLAKEIPFFYYYLILIWKKKVILVDNSGSTSTSFKTFEKNSDRKSVV